MKSFTYQGVEYRSMFECCKTLNISYQKVRRLCRHYRRAHDDPAQAVRWCLGVDKLSHLEPKTLQYAQDLEKSYDRQEKFKDRIYQKFVESF